MIRTAKQSFCLLLYLLAFLIPLLLNGCAAKKNQQSQISTGDPIASSPKQMFDLSLQPLTIPEDNLLETINIIYQEWKGVPYKYSGQSKNGIDCSGLSQVIYKRLFNCDLPRTVNGQMQVGEEVDFDKLYPGDLVFFQTTTATKHVGIYTNSGSFVHASTKYGVTQSSFSNRYWKKRYITARRLINKTTH